MAILQDGHQLRIIMLEKYCAQDNIGLDTLDADLGPVHSDAPPSVIIWPTTVTDTTCII